MQGEECLLFAEMDDDLTVTEAELDELLIVGGGQERTIKHLQALDLVGRSFLSFADLAPAVQAAMASGSPVDQESRQLLMDYIQASMLFSEVPDDLEVTAAELDAIIIAAHGTKAALQVLKRFDVVARRFSSFQQLLPAMQQALETHSAVTDSMRAAIVGYLQDDQCMLFSEAEQDLQVTSLALDLLLEKAGGVSNALARLKQLDADQRRFQDFRAVVDAMEG